MASLYLHIPFCERKCLYCDFYSIETVSGTGAFLEALAIEAEREGASCREPVTTVYFGGGTPSLLEPSQLETLLARLHRSFVIAPGAEVTVEVNPGTVTREKLASYRSLGVNRLSIGVQSFRESELRFLGRIHDAGQAIRCVQDARLAGFDNLSIDLLYALPDQDEPQWISTLERAMGFDPEHVSAYSLIVEDQTPLASMVAGGRVRPASIDVEAAMYATTMEFMERRGYEHYEVSNYARPGFRSRHNSAYWTHDNYIGLGPSAHSFRLVAGARTARRWGNVANLSAYVERLRRGEPATGFEETVSAAELANERIFLGLRSDGLDIAGLERAYGVQLRRVHGAVVDGLLAEGLAVLRGDVLRLTPRGFLLCDEVAGRLML